MENNNENEQQQKNIAVQKPETVKQPGESNATASFVLGLVGLLLGFSVIVPLVLGIIGVVQANKAKERGCNNSLRTAGFVLSIISIIVGGVSIIPILLLPTVIIPLLALCV